MNGKIYIIRNDVNDKVYIGQTKRSIEKRFQEHTTLTEAKRSLVLARAIQKYGADKFHVELLQDGLTSTEALDAAEIRYIKEFGSVAPSGYNVTGGGLDMIRWWSTRLWFLIIFLAYLYEPLLRSTDVLLPK